MRRGEAYRAAFQAWVDREVRALSIDLAVEQVLVQQGMDAQPDAHAERETLELLRRISDRSAGELSHGPG